MLAFDHSGDACQIFNALVSDHSGSEAFVVKEEKLEEVMIKTFREGW